MEQSGASDGAVFGLIIGVMIVAVWLVYLGMVGYQTYGTLPRGIRWVVKVGPAAWGVFTRIFYGDVLKQREAEKLRIEREDGMTPWWDGQKWRPGSVKEVKNQYNFVIARRPADYVNRVATPGNKGLFHPPIKDGKVQDS